MDADPFLPVVLADRYADAPRLVYADWLEERGDPRAELLRLDCDLRKQTTVAPRSRALARLRQLYQSLDPDWVALVRRQPIVDAAEAALVGLEHQLAGTNYVVQFVLRRVPDIPTATTADYVRVALGSVGVAGTSAVTQAALVREVESCLRYRGDNGAGPRPNALRSKVFKRLLEELLTYLNQTLKDAIAIEVIWYEEGQLPFRPGEWDFSFFIAKERFNIVFVGSSSD